MSLLQVRRLDVFFDTPDGRLVGAQDIAFSVEPGRTTALVGESGSGKTVSAMSVLQLLPYPVAGHSPDSEILWKGQDLLKAPAKALRSIRGNEISMIFQEPQISLNPVQRIDRQVAEILVIHQRIDWRSAREQVPDLLADVGLTDPERQARAYPHQLSGGQRQRVMIAMALANDPDLLIADEPTTALDVTIQAQILELLREKQRERNMAMLLITHDLDVVGAMADDIVVMEKGHVVETGTAREILETPKHPYTRMLIDSQPSGTPAPVPEQAKPVIETTDLRVHFPILAGVLKTQVGSIKAVDGVTLSIREGETLGIVGESGSGKSTLGMALLRLLSAQGPITYLGQSIEGASPATLVPLRREMQVVFQDPFSSLSPRMTVGEIVGEGLSVHARELDAATVEARVIGALEMVGLDPAARHRFPHEFSGGQRQRVAVARALILEPRLIILDEPTSALDMTVQAQLVDLLRDLQARLGLAYLFISHDLKVVRAMSHRILVMRNGKVVESGETEGLFADPREPYTRALLRAATELAVDEAAAVRQ
ncbi:MAG: ABC transporter ATP-binding protein [Pseudomonadota bacterium]|nr:ABC transporter ATP-binding protein [Pseudomonadota bacterium]